MRSTEYAVLLQSKSWFLEKHLSDVHHPLFQSVKKLLLMSDYACRHVLLLKNLLAHDACSHLLSRDDYFHRLKEISLSLPNTTYSRVLRQFRNTQLLRLLLLQTAGILNTEEVMRSWSDCADAIILHALDYCQYSLSLRHGMPYDREGNEVFLFILAMGKLGGQELNFSSDVDLIFTYTAEGKTDGEDPIENQQFFSKIVQQIISVLQNSTPDGFVFRVDLRLRPNGESGSLVSSFAAMETYYQEQGRDWERYAMVKARVITKSVDARHPWFERLIVPFVYRRYVDFSVIESLRSMKAMIEREVALNPRLDDIKRGKGGIREVEFVIQSFQLIRGGRIPQLQGQNALSALSVLKQEQLVLHTDALKQAYLFLRQLENTLQCLNDQQTHSLPEERMKREQVILAMGFSSWEQFLIKLNQYQRIISYVFHSVLGQGDDYEDDKRLLTHQLNSLWHGHVETDMAVNLLTSLGYTNASYCYQLIYSFRHSPRCRRLTQAARLRLDRLMVMLLLELTHVQNTDEVLLQVMNLLESIVGRSAYLALITENPQVLTELLFCFAQSPFITSLLVNQPFLLEVLLDQGQKWRPLSLPQLQKQLLEQLAHHDDIELQEEILRQFKLAQWLMAARAELYGFFSAVRIGKFLSDVAQVIVHQVLVIAQEQLIRRYPEMIRTKSHFAIIAYGKLGSREMNYASDLDLVFLYASKPSEEALVTRLTQKMLHMLTTRSQFGLLYRVDTRLRPSGSAGLLVSHVDAFIEYQKNQAWIWEHQALLKARIISGTPKIRTCFAQLKKSVLRLHRPKKELQQNIVSMRAKIDQYHAKSSLDSGLLDLEFLVQYLILNLSDPSCARYTNTLSQLRHLFSLGALNNECYSFLKKAYTKYHQLLHQSLLCPNKVPDEGMHAEIWVLAQEFFKN